MATLQRKKKFLVWGNGHTQRTFWREETALLQPCDCSRICQPDASWALRLRTGDTGVGAAAARRRTWQRRAPRGPGLSPAVLPASSHPLTPMPDPSGSPDGPAFEAHLSPTRSSHLPAAGPDPKFCGASNTGDTSSPSEVAGGRTAAWGTVPPRRHPETRCGAVPQVQPEAPGGASAGALCRATCAHGQRPDAVAGPACPQGVANVVAGERRGVDRSRPGEQLGPSAAPWEPPGLLSLPLGLFLKTAFSVTTSSRYPARRPAL